MEQKGVSRMTQKLVYCYLNMKTKRDQMKLQESSVELLRMLPSKLLQRLRYDFYAGLFTAATAHPMMSWMERDHGQLSHQLCYTALTESVWTRASEVFNPSSFPLQMFFIGRGEVDFVPSSSSHLADTVEKCSISENARVQWFCEVALWLRWTHDGRTTATCYTSLIELHVHEPLIFAI